MASDTPENNQQSLLIAKLLSQSEKQSEIKIKEIEADDKEKERQFQYALKAMEHDKSCREMASASGHKTFKIVIAFAIFIIILFVAFFVYCIQKGQQDIVISILKYLGTAVLSFFGGVQYGKKRRISQDKESIE